MISKLVLKTAIGLILLAALAGLTAFIVLEFRRDLSDSRPHIVVFLADDLGYDDVSFHGNHQIPTPNLDAMAADGVILNRHYASMSGTPSRGAFFTAKLPLRIGLNEAPILNGVYGSGLSLNHRLTPSYLRDLGYETHLIGRWSLGFYKTSLLPTKRGFDSHYGPYSDTGSYYSHLHYEAKWAKFGVPPAYDLHRNAEPDYESFGTYITTLYSRRFRQIVEKRTKPLFVVVSHMAPHGASVGPLHQAPRHNLSDSSFDHIKDRSRRAYAGSSTSDHIDIVPLRELDAHKHWKKNNNNNNNDNNTTNNNNKKQHCVVKSLDDSFGEAVALLQTNGILNNSVILFSSDNGGTTFVDSDFKTGASNWPLRGQKHTQWEGGVRVASFIWSSLISKPYVSNKLYHFVDWLPTFVSLAGGNATDIQNIDGVNVWRSIVDFDTPSPRKSILLAYDREGTEDSVGVAAIMGQYKYVSGKWKARNHTNYYLPAGFNAERGHDHHLEKMTIDSIVSKALGNIRRPIGDRSKNWRDQAVVRCSWDRRLKCNNVDCGEILTNATGSVGNSAGEQLEIEVIAINASQRCDFTHDKCLFDLDSDPCETTNIAAEFPAILDKIHAYVFNNFDPVDSTAKRSYVDCFDQNSNPAREDPFVWKPWRTTCDHLLDETCPDRILAGTTANNNCPPGGHVVESYESNQ